jgi:hypothetical protein
MEKACSHKCTVCCTVAGRMPLCPSQLRTAPLLAHCLQRHRHHRPVRRTDISPTARLLVSCTHHCCTAHTQHTLRHSTQHTLRHTHSTHTSHTQHTHCTHCSTLRCSSVSHVHHCAEAAPAAPPPFPQADRATTPRGLCKVSSSSQFTAHKQITSTQCSSVSELNMGGHVPEDGCSSI